eukprot:sb/3465653/
MRRAEEAARLEEERKHAEILEQLQAEQRLRDHLESIRTITEKTPDRSGTLDLKTYNLTDLTSAIFDTTDVLGEVEDPTLGTMDTLSSLDYRGSYHPADHEEEDDNTTHHVEDDSPVDNTVTPTLLPSPITIESPKVQNTDLLGVEKDGTVIRGVTLEDIFADISPATENLADITPTGDEEVILRGDEAPDITNTLDRALDNTSDTLDRALGTLDNTSDTLDRALGTLDRTLEAEMEKLARWSRGSFPDTVTMPTTLNLSDSKHSTMETEDSTLPPPGGGHVIKSEPITALDSLTRVSFVSVTPTNGQTSLEAVLEGDGNDVTHVSTFSLNTLGGDTTEGDEEEMWPPRDRIRGVTVNPNNRECSLKLSLAQTLSHGMCLVN